MHQKWIKKFQNSKAFFPPFSQKVNKKVPNDMPRKKNHRWGFFYGIRQISKNYLKCGNKWDTKKWNQFLPGAFSHAFPKIATKKTRNQMPQKIDVSKMTKKCAKSRSFFSLRVPKNAHKKTQATMPQKNPHRLGFFFWNLSDVWNLFKTRRKIRCEKMKCVPPRIRTIFWPFFPSFPKNVTKNRCIKNE